MGLSMNFYSIFLSGLYGSFFKSPSSIHQSHEFQIALLWMPRARTINCTYQKSIRTFLLTFYVNQMIIYLYLGFITNSLLPNDSSNSPVTNWVSFLVRLVSLHHHPLSGYGLHKHIRVAEGRHWLLYTLIQRHHTTPLDVLHAMLLSR